MTGGQPGVFGVAAGCVLLGLFGGVASIVRARLRAGYDGERRTRDQAPPRPRISGPAGHAGPGAIGGPQSIRR